VAGWILELDRGYGIPWKGNYSSWLEQKQERLAQEEKQEALRQKTLQRELEWLHMSPKRGRPSARRASTPTTNCWRRKGTRQRRARNLHSARPRAWAMS
jgi:sulfate-transporting ATPase